MDVLESGTAGRLDTLPEQAGSQPAVEIAHLRKTYGPLVAVDDVSFSVAEGEIFGILGPNGAGKTTTVECAIGLRTPDTTWVRRLVLRLGEDARVVAPAALADEVRSAAADALALYE